MNQARADMDADALFDQLDLNHDGVITRDEFKFLQQAPDHPARDAEMSVDFLCRKFEVFSGQLRLEEMAHEAAQQRGQMLQAEVKSAEEALARQDDALANELQVKTSLLASKRASADDAGQRVAMQNSKVAEEKAARARLEQQCAELDEEYRVESARRELTVAQLTDQDRELAQERCEQAELARRLRQIQADSRVLLEDLRIAEQRSLLVCSEQQSLERGLEAMGRNAQLCGHEGEVHARHLQERRWQIREHEARLASTFEAIEAARSESTSCCRELAELQGLDQRSQAQLASLRQEALDAQNDFETQGWELRSEAAAFARLSEELEATELSSATSAAEITEQRRAEADAQAKFERLRQSMDSVRHAHESVLRHLEDLSAEEQRQAKAAQGLRQRRQQEDLTFEDVQGELQAAFRQREALSEDLAMHSHAYDAAAVQLRRLQPEVADAEGRCRFLEGQLAQQAREVEEELMQQRRSRQEVVVATETVYRLMHEEARLEAALSSGWAPYVAGTSGQRAAGREVRGSSQGASRGLGSGEAVTPAWPSGSAQASPARSTGASARGAIAREDATWRATSSGTCSRGAQAAASPARSSGASARGAFSREDAAWPASGSRACSRGAQVKDPGQLSWTAEPVAELSLRRKGPGAVGTPSPAPRLAAGGEARIR